MVAQMNLIIGCLLNMPLPYCLFLGIIDSSIHLATHQIRSGKGLTLESRFSSHVALVQQQHFWDLALEDTGLKITQGKAWELFIKQISANHLLCFRSRVADFF